MKSKVTDCERPTLVAKIRQSAKGLRLKPPAAPKLSGSYILRAIALGAVATGTLAVGNFVVVRLGIGRLSVRQGRIRRLRIDELEVGSYRSPHQLSAAANGQGAPEKALALPV
jgi:hypothetical protein